MAWCESERLGHGFREAEDERARVEVLTSLCLEVSAESKASNGSDAKRKRNRVRQGCWSGREAAPDGREDCRAVGLRWTRCRESTVPEAEDGR